MTEKSYKDSLNLPQTEMPMKAGLTQIEPQLVQKWEKENPYFLRLEQNKGNESFILHDGPPYPNGNIHLGHALNKILKDIVVKYHLLKGHFSPYVPGWDCHGLPIETQLLKDLKKKDIKESEIDEFRDQCKAYALKYVEQQKEQFKHLGIFGDFAKPYLTLDPLYEKAVIELFGKLADNNLIYQGKKPIHWCFHCKTALAEAEIEYDDEKSPSIYVKFPLTVDFKKHKKVSLLVWTTTPWTLPANVAVAVHPGLTYILAETNKGLLIFAEDLKEVLTQKLELGEVRVLETMKGKELLDLRYKHPFADRLSPVVLGNFVSNEDGTGLVHIAPGHGYDDYLVGLEYKLPMIMPVDESGIFTEEADAYAGLPVFEANKNIVQDLEKSGHLLKME
ncbi:MAG: class I tRNA ligase family protein, partial [Candidatus Margulisbacteria bacterium]|nr:class I tRNA ligase family protein [Candidatus Margulisiibacteriota bacterium]